MNKNLTHLALLSVLALPSAAMPVLANTDANASMSNTISITSSSSDTMAMLSIDSVADADDDLSEFVTMSDEDKIGTSGKGWLSKAWKKFKSIVGSMSFTVKYKGVTITK
jgi:hypothetical protein